MKKKVFEIKMKRKKESLDIIHERGVEESHLGK